MLQRFKIAHNHFNKFEIRYSSWLLLNIRILRGFNFLRCVVTQHNVARVQHAVVFNLGEIHFLNNVLKHKKLFPRGNSFVLYE